MNARLAVVGVAVLAIALLVGVVVMRSPAPSAMEVGGTAPSTPSATQSASPTPFAFPSVAVPATTTPAPTVSPSPTVEPTASAAAAAPAQTAPAQTSATQTQTPTRAPVAQAPVTQAPAPQPTEAPAPVVTPAPTAAPTQAPPPPPAATAPPPAATAPPSGGFVFPTFFVAITDSRNGRVSVTVNPGASCSAIARLPDNVTVLQLGTQVAPGSGALTWTYPPAPPSSSLGVHRVDCSLGSDRAFAEARFVAN